MEKILIIKGQVEFTQQLVLYEKQIVKYYKFQLIFLTSINQLVCKLLNPQVYGAVEVSSCHLIRSLHNLQVTILGCCKTPDILQALGKNLRKSNNLRVYVVARRLDFLEKIDFLKILNNYESFKTEYIYKNHLWLNGPCLGL